MADAERGNHGEEDVNGLRAWAAVTVRQAHATLQQAREDPGSAAVRLVFEHLVTIERLLPERDPARATVVPWLGLLMQLRLRGRPDADARERAAALGHLRWTDRARPLEDGLAMAARQCLATLLIPPDLPPEVREGSAPPDLVEALRERLTEAMEVLARVVVGDLRTREAVLPVMERVATLLSSLPAPPEEDAPSASPEGGAAAEVPGPSGAASPEGPELPEGPDAEAPADSVRGVLDWARRDPVGFGRLLEWLCVTVADPPISPVDADRELADLGLDRPERAPLRELLVALRSEVRSPRSLAARVHGVARAVREVFLPLPVDAPERIRVAKFHAALLVAERLRVPGTLDFDEVDAAVSLPDPDPAVHAAWRRELGLETILSTTIDNLWVSNGELARLERSVAWLRQSIDALPAEGARAAATRRHLTGLLAHRVATAGTLGGSLQDGVTALAMAQAVSPAGEGEDVVALFGLVTAAQTAGRSRDPAAVARAAQELIGTLTERYADPSPDASTRFFVTGTLGLVHAGRAARTGDRSDQLAAVRYLREAVEVDPDTMPPLFVPYVPAGRAHLMIELATVDPRPEVVDRAVVEARRVLGEARMPHWEEARLRLALGRLMLRATTHRSDLRLLDPCIEELSRVRAMAAAGYAPPLNVEVLTALSTAYWTSAVTGGPRGSEDAEASRETRREALELTAADVLLQLGADHALSAARSATGHALWLAQRCAEGGRGAEAVEALELGRSLVLQTAAAAHGVPRLLADRGHGDLAARWRAQTPRRPFPVGEGDGRGGGDAVGEGKEAGPSAGRGGGDAVGGGKEAGPSDGRATERPAAGGEASERDALRSTDPVAEAPTVPGAELPSSLRRTALAALGAGNGAGARELLGTPDVAGLSAALAASGADALVYLVPGEGFRPHVPGHALILRPGDTEPGVLPLPLLLSPGSHQLQRYLAAAAARTRAIADRGTTPAGRTARDAAEAEWRAALGELCDWAWAAAIGPVLDTLGAYGRRPRIVLVPCGPLGVVPWHAARRHIPLGGPLYACQGAVFSYAPSGAQFVRAAARDRLPPSGRQVLVSDPRLDLVWAEIETEALRTACYPDARRYGEFVAAEGVPDAPGDCADLLAALPGGDQAAAVVHVSCHGVAGPSPTRSALSLADGELTVARILDHSAAAAPGPDGPLVVLSACETDVSTGDHDEALTLSTALVARGAADVVGSRWAVDDSATALMMTVFHHFLTHEGLAPADALRAAQLWMLDPSRRPPPGLEGPLLREASRPDLPEIHLWAAFTHQGNPAPR
ncbi:CHAT domain-containing protein [Streptomyces sp. NPDC008121]|uniref:CHAT domain-containing protein n=1 Tax=Streptomyces sp. NPDC008121 TaxID=3364809 RepID=UPI0036ECD054